MPQTRADLCRLARTRRQNLLLQGRHPKLDILRAVRSDLRDHGLFFPLGDLDFVATDRQIQRKPAFRVDNYLGAEYSPAGRLYLRPTPPDRFIRVRPEQTAFQPTDLHRAVQEQHIAPAGGKSVLCTTPAPAHPGERAVLVLVVDHDVQSQQGMAAPHGWRSVQPAQIHPPLVLAYLP